MKKRADNSIIITSNETYNKNQLPSKTTASNYHNDK